MNIGTDEIEIAEDKKDTSRRRKLKRRSKMVDTTKKIDVSKMHHGHLPLLRGG